MRKILIIVWLIAFGLVGIATGLLLNQPKQFMNGATEVSECMNRGGNGWYIIDTELYCLYE